ncbi:MAG: chromosomal replication initiator protein DnaA [Candidatus Omnitrophica bacterium]|nr:chromosomal replication initiator protein DnaA [Candidatus Omnitrophota bacterium]
MKNIWKKALALLKTEVNEQVFTAWFTPIQQISIDEDSIALGLPNKFFENWIREKYAAVIQNAINRASGKDLSISFKITEDLSTACDPETLLATVNRPSSKSDPKKNEPQDSSMGWLRSVFGTARSKDEPEYKTIGLNQKYTFDDFVVGPSNRFSHAAALAVCDKLAKAYNPLFLYGGVGLGKTHLMQAMGHEIMKRHPRARVLYTSSEEFTNHLITAIRKKNTQKFRSMYRTVDVLLIDDIQFIAGKESTQEEFFHTFNKLHDSHKQIVLCSDSSPQEINGLEERLVSRFAWGLITDIQPPGFETRMAIMQKKSDSESVSVPKDVLYFLAENIRTNIREMEGALIRVVAFSKLTGEPMSEAMAKSVLGGMITAAEKMVTVELIQNTVSGYFSIDPSSMKTKKRTRAVAYPRQLAMYISRELTDHSLPDIGSLFGGRDHTTVLHAWDKIDKEIQNRDETRSIVNKLISMIRN